MQRGLPRRGRVSLSEGRRTSPNATTTPDKVAREAEVTALCHKYWTVQFGEPRYVPALKRKAWLLWTGDSWIARTKDGSEYTMSEQWDAVLKELGKRGAWKNTENGG